MLTGAIEDQDLIDGLGLVFLLSGAALVAITYVLFQQATEYTKPHLPSIPHTPAIQQPKLPQLPWFLPQLAHDQYQLTQDRQQLARDQLPPLGQAAPRFAYSVPQLGAAPVRRQRLTRAARAADTPACADRGRARQPQGERRFTA